MPSDDATKLAKKLVEAYRASGICAKTHRGRLLVEREDGWEGPLDPHELRTTYLDEIARVEQRVREVVAASYARWDQRPPGDPLEDPWVILLKWDGSVEFRKEMWLNHEFSPENLIKTGLSEATARRYVDVARSLQYRNDLWR